MIYSWSFVAIIIIIKTYINDLADRLSINKKANPDEKSLFSETHNKKTTAN